MNFAKYNNTYPYPSKADFTTTYYYKFGELVAVSKGEGINHIKPEIEIKNCVKDVSFRRADYLLELSNHHKAGHDAELQFKADLADELGLTGHPKWDKLFDIAWEEEHDCGYEAVYNYASTLAELLY